MGKSKIVEILYIEKFDWNAKSLVILPISPPLTGTQYTSLRKFTKTLELLGIKPLSYGFKHLRRNSEEATVRCIRAKITPSSPLFRFF